MRITFSEKCESDKKFFQKFLKKIKEFYKKEKMVISLAIDQINSLIGRVRDANQK